MLALVGAGPFSAVLGGPTGISPYKVKVENYLSNLREYFTDKKAVEEILSRGEDPLIYVVYELNREARGEFNIGCTIIYPGKIGDEYYFTKGHFHEKKLASEVYIGMKGKGIILMQDRKGATTALEIEPNTLVYIPPGMAHRSINIGKTDLVFLAIYPSDAGHNYETIRKAGFAKIVVERGSKPVIIDNPDCK